MFTSLFSSEEWKNLSIFELRFGALDITDFNIFNPGFLGVRMSLHQGLLKSMLDNLGILGRPPRGKIHQPWFPWPGDDPCSTKNRELQNVHSPIDEWYWWRVKVHQKNRSPPMLMNMVTEWVIKSFQSSFLPQKKNKREKSIAFIGSISSAQTIQIWLFTDWDPMGRKSPWKNTIWEKIFGSLFPSIKQANPWSASKII